MNPSKGKIEILEDRCKGCELCVAFCPRGCIRISGRLNNTGYHPAEPSGDKCTGCGICYLVCPEPGCITVYRDED